MLWFPRSPGNFFKLPLHCLSLTLSSNSYSSEFNSFRHFQKTINYYSLSQFRQKYGELKPGEKLMEIPIQIAGYVVILKYLEAFNIKEITLFTQKIHYFKGRIITKRTAGRNLIFYDLAQDCNNLQVVANSKRFETLNTFDNINKIARNNCVIGLYIFICSSSFLIKYKSDFFYPVLIHHYQLLKTDLLII
jgi:lysyl-tRNA synthetase class II